MAFSPLLEEFYLSTGGREGRDIRGEHERDCNTDRAKIRQDEEEENSVRNL